MGGVIDGVTWLLRILFAVRVSVINVVSSLALFWFAVQAQDLLADQSFQEGWQYLFWFGVFAATFLLWAFPVHYGARRTLEEDSWIIQRATRDGLAAHCRDDIVRAVREDYCWAIEWVPRVLGLMPFVALAVGVWGALGAIGGASALQETSVARTQLWTLLGADAVTALAFVVFVIKRKALFPDWTGEILHPVALLATGAIFVLAYVLPVWTAIHLPRALLVPPLFGSLVLFTSWLQRLGNRTGFPFLVALGVVAGLLTAWNAGFNNLRTLPPASSGPSADARLTIDEAVARWKKANGCDTQCPHPVVVAIDGGASRAAFTAATFLGELFDHAAPAKDGEAKTPGRQVFALSGVSGGAYGAAVIQTALRDGQSQGTSGAPPCHSARSTWFGFDEWKRAGNIFTWRRCLQALTSGDYLSPTIIGLAFRDFAAPPWQMIPGLPPMSDRAGLLEQTWEQQYSATMKPGLTWFLDGDRCDAGDPQGLCRRAAHPADVVDPDGKAWMPMLFLNGTSVATGRRIVSADIRSKADATQPVLGGALYPEAYDLREAMASPCPNVPPPTALAGAYPIKHLAAAAKASKNERTVLTGTCGVKAPIDGPDVRLSTAALTSARFPVISPAGIFSMNAQRYGDQVVDGGYFENSGITTALEIVRALRTAKLEPLLVSIANNPQLDVATEADLAKCAGDEGASSTSEQLARCSGLPRRPAPTPLVFMGDTSFFGRFAALVLRPVQTILGTRDGHADEAMGQAELAFANGGLFKLKVDVAPTFGQRPDLPLADDERCSALPPDTKLVMPEVSMSWWLSASVQADLDVQRCSLANRSQLRDLMAAMGRRDAILP